jgi:hemerythrin
MDRWLNEHVHGADTEMARFIRSRTGELRASL